MEWYNRGRQLRWKDKMKAGTLGGLVGNDLLGALQWLLSVQTVYMFIQSDATCLKHF